MVHIVRFHIKILFEVHLNICSRLKMQKTFSGRVRVKIKCHNSQYKDKRAMVESFQQYTYTEHGVS